MLQGLLKDQPQLTAVKIDGKTRWAIKPLEDDLSFDKAGCCLSQWHIWLTYIRSTTQLPNPRQHTLSDIGLSNQLQSMPT